MAITTADKKYPPWEDDLSEGREAYIKRKYAEYEKLHRTQNKAPAGLRPIQPITPVFGVLSPSSPGMEVDLVSAGRLWLTRHGDTWVVNPEEHPEKDYATIFHRLNTRGWFEHFNDVWRLLPEELWK
jgi:hypothetical protein